MSVLVDTGPLYAFFDKKDQYNHWCGEQFAEITSHLITCEAVIAETVFLMLRSGINPDLLFEFADRGHLHVLSIVNKPEGMKRIRVIINNYTNLPASYADACLVYLAESTKKSQILTVDNHFTLYRTSKGNPLSLISPF